MAKKVAKVDNAVVVQNETLIAIQEAIKETHRTASAGRTPATQIKRRPDGYDYVEEGYMRKKLNDFFPIWDWLIDENGFLGAEWCWVRGTLIIKDNGIERRYSAMGAKRIQFKRGTPHVPENIVDIGNNVKAAATDAFKVAANRLCNIADDVYRKHVEIQRELNDNQKETIVTLLEEIGDHALSAKVTMQMADGKIHSVNYKAALDRLKKMKGNKENE